MRKSNHTVIREMLRSLPDGATPPELEALTGVDCNAVHRALHSMPDAYIDRWVPVHGRGGWSAVWCVAHKPPNCPRPDAPPTADQRSKYRVRAPYQHT